MSVQANDSETLRRYAAWVIGRPDSDAVGVKAITLALVGGIIWKDDPGSATIERNEDGRENTLWASLAGRRLAFVHDHPTEAIQMREGSSRGKPLQHFTNRTLLNDIDRLFARLVPV